MKKKSYYSFYFFNSLFIQGIIGRERERERVQFPFPNFFWISLKDTVADPLLLAFCWEECSLHPVMKITYNQEQCQT